MSTGLHSAREHLHLPQIGQPPSFLQGDAGASHGQLKPLTLSPRTFGMEDLRDFCGPLGSFKTGLTPRVFSTGLTPRSGFTPRFTTGFTPRINAPGLSAPDTNSFFSRNTGFSPRQNEQVNKISPTGFTPKDVSAMKVPMRFPGQFSNTPQKLGEHQHQMASHSMQQHKPGMQMPQHMPHMASQPNHPGHHHPEMNSMHMPMFDYMNRPVLSPPQQHHPHHISAPMKPQKNVSPMSEDNMEEPEDLDERRRMKNRERVRKCRKRKQDRLNFLEDRTAELEKENHMLKTKLSRSSGAGSNEPLSETQLSELRQEQTSVLFAYMQANNEANTEAFENLAKSVWSERAEIIYGSKNTSVVGVDQIIAAKAAASTVFKQLEIVNHSVQWRENAPTKCVVNWEVEVVLHSEAPTDAPLTAPFGELARFVSPEDKLTIHFISHLTFEDGLIIEEIRQLNLAQMTDGILNKFAPESGKAFQVLRCLMNA
ncbi:hypothetical protein Poli38472_000566 [Pythium oligandrum]|uniref:BZIP domain-containing protein n=1 Tax=Pythium oligandrum TaxID=41045 RepID=A0A8K1FGZ8_PYTOL|nr:hypothetical protein Poli38472_000566 [Pythium oligandrum]|eukprot:TMW60524.1 hypothetical protein Poli38472_000566 [Pythium oligandrum]